MTLFKELKPNCFYAVDDNHANIVTADNYWDVHCIVSYKGTTDLSLIGLGEVEFNYNPCFVCPSYSINGYDSAFGHSRAPYADMVSEYLERRGFHTYTDIRDRIRLFQDRRKIILQIPVHDYGSGRSVIVDMDMENYVQHHYGNTKLLAMLKKQTASLRFPFGAKQYFQRILNAKTQIEAAIALLEYEAHV